METQADYQERMAAKIAKAKWPNDVPVPETQPKLRLSGTDGNAFAILAAARAAGRNGKWTDPQIEAFTTLARSGDYDHVIQTCMRYFDVR